MYTITLYHPFQVNPIKWKYWKCTSAIHTQLSPIILSIWYNSWVYSTGTHSISAITLHHQASTNIGSTHLVSPELKDSTPCTPVFSTTSICDTKGAKVLYKRNPDGIFVPIVKEDTIHIEQATEESDRPEIEMDSVDHQGMLNMYSGIPEHWNHRN
ncbi:hypothetical protein BDZ94DRAFT_1308522 [Collybia nuda]|uniref:Uncharacterized protein n=1 Tax=Collybia nuda TaxID=64659 RepID=A0A9P5Y9L6_9AGAR|nr:hypothetical protein BDZ94DRAFT_1308522 [Collybia nuda]